MAISKKDAAKYRRRLRDLGIEYPFLEGVDSFLAFFQSVKENALRNSPSLAGIEELSVQEFENTAWERYGLRGEWSVNFPDLPESPESRTGKANVRVFITPQGVRSFIRIRITDELMSGGQETAAGVMLPWLLHELGHVYDLEHKINIDPETGRIDPVAAEVFAHRYTLDRLSEYGMSVPFNFYLKTIRDEVNSRSDRMDECQQVLSSHGERTVPMWAEIIERFGS